MLVAKGPFGARCHRVLLAARARLGLDPTVGSTRVMRLWAAVLILIALVVGTRTLIIRPGHSHDIPRLPGVQYPQSCCAGGDCEPAPCEDIEERRDGWHWRNLTFSPYTVRSSPDRRCHVCFGTVLGLRLATRRTQKAPSGRGTRLGLNRTGKGGMGCPSVLTMPLIADSDCDGHTPSCFACNLAKERQGREPTSRKSRFSAA
jgi:hypothetical protein